MKRAIHIVTLLFVLYLKLFAVPSSPKSKIILQKDSSKIEVFLRGDEHSHFYYTSDNIPIAIGNDGSFYYVLLEKDKLKLSTFIAHEKNERNASELSFIKEYSNNAITHLDYIRTQIKSNNENLRKAALKKNEFDNNRLFIGNKKGLVVLVNFANKEMLPNANETFNEMFNAIGYNKNNAVGSVHDYFYDQSYGQFNLTFDVVGPVTLSNNYGYYGTNGALLDGNDMRPNEMVVEACHLADKFVDFSDYDWNGDGEVEQVFIVYAGYGESNGAASNTIWPHKHNLEYTNSGIQKLDGTIINQYACSCELAGYTGKTLNGIGTACHEFSHCFGLPDFYDVEYNGGFGMGFWDVMSSGSHCGPDRHGEVPMGYSAYERQFCGWMEITELNSPCVVKNIPSIGDSPVAYSIYNDNNRNEYFVLENRQNKKWYSYVGETENCHGLLIYHIDYDKKTWDNNKINTNPNHQRYSIVPADMSLGKTSETELRGDLFPGLLNITELTNTSHDLCGGILYNINTDGSYYMNKPLTNISENDGFISFDFMGGIFVPKPHSISAEVEDDNTFVVKWDMDGEADSYEVEAVEIRKKTPLESLMISENFANFQTEPGSDDGKKDLSTYLNLYTQISGWSGKRIYTSAFGAKIGSRLDPGHLMTPFKETNSNSITIKLTVRSLKDTITPICVSLVSEKNDTVSSYMIMSSHESTSYVFPFTDLREGYYAVNLEGDQPFYIAFFSMFDGNFSENDLSVSSMIGIITPIEKYLVTGITEKTYKFANLKAKEFRFRVRAEKDKAFSAWTEYDTIKLDGPTGIFNKNYNSNSNVKIYNLNGTKAKYVNKGGTYIYDYGTHRKKIFVKFN